ncbi:tyrosine-type recombinase/integrase [Pantoea dispersa]
MLTVRQIDAAKPREKSYRLSDAGGLFLFVPPTGKKVWRLRYRFDGKEKTLVIGPWPHISLAEARARQAEAKMTLLSGVDPARQKQALKQKEPMPDTLTFEGIFREWYAHKSQVWSAGYADELYGMFTTDILPLIGHLRMDEIEPTLLLKVIRRYEDRGALERASKARRRCGEVFRYAIVTGRARYNPAPDLIGAQQSYQKKNFPFLTMDRIQAFHRALDSYSGSVIVKNAALVLHYTALRTKEVRFLRWENVDFESRLITVDAEIMKSRRIHIVPMSDQVHALMSLTKKLTERHTLCFPGRSDPKKPISENAILGLIRRLGYEGQTTGHGFRHQFSTVMNELHWNSDAIEAQLAHVNSQGTRGVYNHAQYLNNRYEMMQRWADWLDGRE